MEHITELLRYRGLLRNMVVRDLKARYKNSGLGFAWCLGNPLLMMAVFTVVFTVLMRSNIEKFPVFLMVGLLPWNFTVTSVTGSISCVVGNSGLIKKVYFPREILPMSVVLSNLVNFLLALVVLVALILVFQVRITPYVLYFPLILGIQIIFLMGLAFLFSSLNVFFRDTEVIMEVLILAWFFLTPVFYRIEDLTQQWSRLMYILNPMASLISSYRLILYNGASPALDFLLRTLLTSLVILAGGYWLFRSQSARFGEEI